MLPLAMADQRVNEINDEKLIGKSVHCCLFNSDSLCQYENAKNQIEM